MSATIYLFPCAYNADRAHMLKQLMDATNRTPIIAGNKIILSKVIKKNKIAGAGK